MTPLLSIRDLCVSIQNHDILKGISLDLYPGEILGLIGFSGSGKSTLAQSILKLISPNLKPVYTGSVLFKSENIYQSNMRLYRGKKIGMIFQDPRSSLNPSIRVGKQVQESLDAHFNLSRKDSKEQVSRLFSDLGLPVSALSRYPHELSGGMNQRVLIANALICAPEILIADEPTASLDPARSLEILTLFKEYAKKGISTILISHDLYQLIKLSDRLAIMHEGKIVELGTKDQICKNPQHPLTKNLMEIVLNETLF